jgi:hypothetical protein
MNGVFGICHEYMVLVLSKPRPSIRQRI